MKLSNLICPAPVKARHAKRTFVFSPDDDPSRPSAEVILFALDAVRRAMDIDLSAVSSRMKAGPRWPDVWPGEHYKLLAGMVALLKPQVVIEIGTYTGLSALSMKQYLPPGGKLVSFDLVKWDAVPDTILKPSDFEDGRLEQVLCDLSDPAVFAKHAGLISKAGLIFADGPKDRKFEPAFARHMDQLELSTPPWIVWDDIKDLNMLKFWRLLEKPKLDLTSFGHWTGTGLCRWSRGKHE